MNFHYTAVARDSTVVQGDIEARNNGLAEDRLQQQGLRVVTLKAMREGSRLAGLFTLSSKSVSRKELANFSQQLSILLSAGTPLLSALQLLRDQARNPVFKKTIDALVADLKAGASLHGAMERFPEAFPQVYIRLVEAGEKSGTLESMLRHLTAYIQKEASAIQQAKKALTYPAIVGVVGLVVVAIMLTVVLPAMAELLASFRVELPLITRMVIGFSDVFQKWKLHVLIVLVVGTSAGMWYFRRPKGKLAWGRIMLGIPWWGQLTIRRSLARFSRIMSLLLGAGLPVPDSLDLARDSSSNEFFRASMTGVREQVMQGRSMAQALGGASFMPGIFVQMVRAGEESGVLEGNLASMAELFEKDVDDQLATMASFLEPAITVVMGVGVGFIALAVLMPMFSLMKNIQ